MNFIFEIIATLLLSPIGAFFWWIFFLCRKPFKYYDTAQRAKANTAVGAGIVLLFIYIVQKLCR